jgi:hypothetical protein
VGSVLRLEDGEVKVVGIRALPLRRFELVLDNGQGIPMTKEELGDPDSNANHLCRMLTGKTALESWSPTLPVYGIDFT